MCNEKSLALANKSLIVGAGDLFQPTLNYLIADVFQALYPIQ